MRRRSEAVAAWAQVLWDHCSPFLLPSSRVWEAWLCLPSVNFNFPRPGSCAGGAGREGPGGLGNGLGTCKA